MADEPNLEDAGRQRMNPPVGQQIERFFFHALIFFQSLCDNGPQ